MATELLTKNETAPSQPPAVAGAEDELRRRARKRVERVHGAKANVAAFLIGMAVLVPVWLAVEWQAAGGFQRWSEGGRPGDWEPWILYIAIPWFLWVVFVVLGAYFDRNKEEEIAREFARLKSLR